MEQSCQNQIPTIFLSFVPINLESTDASSVWFVASVRLPCPYFTGYSFRCRSMPAHFAHIRPLSMSTCTMCGRNGCFCCAIKELYDRFYADDVDSFRDMDIGLFFLFWNLLLLRQFIVQSSLCPIGLHT